MGFPTRLPLWSSRLPSSAKLMRAWFLMGTYRNLKWTRPLVLAPEFA